MSCCRLSALGFVFPCCLVRNSCVWELFWWSVGGSCKKDSRYLCAKGQVLYASTLTEIPLASEETRMSKELSPKAPN